MLPLLRMLELKNLSMSDAEAGGFGKLAAMFQGGGMEKALGGLPGGQMPQLPGLPGGPSAFNLPPGFDKFSKK